jgi:hypothetical protein
MHVAGDELFWSRVKAPDLHQNPKRILRVLCVLL